MSKEDSVCSEESNMPALPAGLVRNDNGRYYHRRRIPKDLLQADGKAEHLKSLKTSNYRSALERFHVADAKLQADWRKLRQHRADFLAARHIEVATILRELTEEDINRIAQHVEAAAWSSPGSVDIFQLPFRSCSNASGLSWSR